MRSTVPISVLLELFKVEKESQKAFVKQLMSAYAVIYLNIESPFIVDIWQADFLSYELSSYTHAKSDSEDKEVSLRETKSTGEVAPIQSISKRKVGRNSLVEKFPNLINSATNYIKLHGYSAHVRRRTSTGTGTGVSVEDVRQHLITSIPGLAEEGISATAVAYLFCPPNKTHIASKRYKGFIADVFPRSEIIFVRRTQMLTTCSLGLK